MNDKKTTIGELLDIQHDQLIQWKSVLKPEVYEALYKKVKDETPDYNSKYLVLNAQETDFSEIPRGGRINEIVHNWGMQLKFAPELKSELKHPPYINSAEA
jgi:hypothetical protein